MFESGYLTLFGKELGEDKCQARQEAQKALVLNALENFKEFDKIFPALVAGLPIHVFKSAYSAREVGLPPLALQSHFCTSFPTHVCIWKSSYLVEYNHYIKNSMYPKMSTVILCSKGIGRKNKIR